MPHFYILDDTGTSTTYRSVEYNLSGEPLESTTINPLEQFNDEEKLLIQTAFDYCDNELQLFLKRLKKAITKEQYEKLSDIVLTKTFIAGGVFRSIFSGGDVNDIDFFFSSEEAIVEFSDIVLSPDFKDTFFKVSERGTYIENRHSGPKITFVTMRYGYPIDVLSTFDFSFNQHSYSPFDNTYILNKATFNKKGLIVNYDEEELESLFIRSIRFLKEGWEIPTQNMVYLLSVYGNLSRGSQKILTATDIINNATLANSSQSPYLLDETHRAELIETVSN